MESLWYQREINTFLQRLPIAQLNKLKTRPRWSHKTFRVGTGGRCSSDGIHSRLSSNFFHFLFIFSTFLKNHLSRCDPLVLLSCIYLFSSSSVAPSTLTDWRPAASPRSHFTAPVFALIAPLLLCCRPSFWLTTFCYESCLPSLFRLSFFLVNEPFVRQLTFKNCRIQPSLWRNTVTCRRTRLAKRRAGGLAGCEGATRWSRVWIIQIRAPSELPPTDNKAELQAWIWRKPLIPVVIMFNHPIGRSELQVATMIWPVGQDIFVCVCVRVFCYLHCLLTETSSKFSCPFIPSCFSAASSILMMFFSCSCYWEVSLLAFAPTLFGLNVL